LIIIFCILTALDIWQAMSSRPHEEHPDAAAGAAAAAAKHLYMFTKHLAESAAAGGAEPENPSVVVRTAKMVLGIAITFGMSIFVNAVNNSLCTSPINP
jgi:hypothetical protein